MGDWESVFREIDDDYLVGIANKGIVKRAYKDIETTSCKLLDGDLNEEKAKDAIAVSVGEETVHIKTPLKESTCSCPSRSICRHVILGILFLKNTAQTEKTQQKTANENTQSDNMMTKKVLQQIEDYPTEKLCKLLGVKGLQELIDSARAGKRPQIDYAAVVTVQPLRQAMAVKLLYPLEYSTCTCRKKEFCVHKAEAVLWCKLESKQISVDALEQEQSESVAYDMEQIQDVALQMRIFLEELMNTGLSRTSQDALDHMERLATICHNAKLPNFEDDWRRLQDAYKKYLSRVASLKIQDLMRRIVTFYRQVELLGQAPNGLAVSKLAGVFRAEYTTTPDLNLIGIASEHFVSKNGYEGDTIYFLEEDTKKWYTYTQAKPLFYDHSARTRQYMQETPWGVTLPLEELAFWHIHLEHAKSDSRGRLSSSKETKGQAICDRRKQNVLKTGDLGNWYYQDFKQMFKEQFQDKMDKLVFLRPATCEKAVFLETEQKLCMNLYDEAGKAVVIEVVYSKDEAEGIRYLENITNENLPCFFGKVYLRDGRIRMIPIAVFGKKELIDGVS